MSAGTDAAIQLPEHGPATTRRVIFTDTRWWVADVDIETADMLLHRREVNSPTWGRYTEGPDMMDVVDVFTRLRRIDPYKHPVEADLSVEAAEDSWLHISDYDVIDGTKPESYYWSARMAVMDARYHLNCGRYREGDCREMDAVNASLARIEDELRLLAMAVDEARDAGADQ